MAAESEAGLAEPAPAKVNLYLHVRRRRDDGLHEIESLAVFPGMGDLVEAAPDSGLSLDLAGPFAPSLVSSLPPSLAGAENLVLAAARALSADTPGKPGARLRLVKRLPVASGVGGGSADAAATLRLLARLWPGAPLGRLPGLAAGLGADVPVCLAGRPALMAGAGERLSPAPPLPAAWLLLANPMLPLSTAEVFAALEARENPPGPPAPAQFAGLDDLARWLALQRNDLEAPARRLRPAVGRVLAALTSDPACRLARMSGSGATCFGLYGAAAEAARAAERLRAAEPGWWVEAAPMETA